MTAVIDNWVVCYDYVVGPFTPAEAAGVKARHDSGRSMCSLEHSIVVFETKPVTGAGTAPADAGPPA